MASASPEDSQNTDLVASSRHYYSIPTYFQTHGSWQGSKRIDGAGPGLPAGPGRLEHAVLHIGVHIDKAKQYGFPNMV